MGHHDILLATEFGWFRNSPVSAKLRTFIQCLWRGALSLPVDVTKEAQSPVTASGQLATILLSKQTDGRGGAKGITEPMEREP